MTHLSLFSGIGGLDLAAEWAGFQTVGQCEWADYPTKVLEKHWPDVPRWRDIRTLTRENFYAKTGLRTVDIISGGFPCQPFSVAGKQKGKGDERYLWPEMLRVIRELAPRWIVAENVPGIIKIAGDTVCQDLEQAGYSVGVFNFEASAVGAHHRRARVFFVADAQGKQGGRVLQRRVQANAGANGKDVADTMCDGSAAGVADSQAWQKGQATEPDHCCKILCDADSRGCARNQRWEYAQQSAFGRRRATEPGLGGVVDGLSNWLYEPDIPRIATGIKDRVDRLKCLGNAVVPQQAYPIFAAIAAIESEAP